jgi:DNA-binding beta-propeller fold protein YncE
MVMAMFSKIAAIVLCVGLFSSPYRFVWGQSENYVAPAGNRFATIVPGGETILPNGRLLTPLGSRLYTGENLWNVVRSPDGRLILGLCGSGIAIYPEQGIEDSRSSYLIPWKQPAFCGHFTRDGKKLIISSGDEGHGIRVLSTEGWDQPPPDRLVPLQPKVLMELSADPETYINDLVLSPDERFVFGADVARQRLVVFDLTEGRVIADVAGGREPFSLAITDDGKRLFVANIGMLDYSLIPDGDGDPRGLAIPAFGFPSPEAEEGVEREGRQVPGLGSPHVADAHSVWMFDIAEPARPSVMAKVKTGLLLHAPSDRGKTEGGSAPNGLLVSGNRLYVSNANNDMVQVFDATTLDLQHSLKLTPEPTLASLRGVIPTGMELSDDGRLLYVCAAGLNAVAVIDTSTMKVERWLPVGWFPTACCLSVDQQVLYVASQKGLGRGPRGPKHQRREDDERYALADMPGMISVIDHREIGPAPQQVLKNNGLIPHPGSPVRLPSAIEYVVFITKENHTFDGIFGGLPGSRSEAEYAEFGKQGWIKENGREERVPIMPNHIQLAEQFAISDNFYMEPQASGDGHRWLVGIYPSFWTTRVFYSGWTFKKSETARGRMVVIGSNGSQIPEDYLENGSLFEHLARGGVTFRNYGEGFEFPDNDEGPMKNRSGAFTQVNYPMPKVLYDNTDFDYPAYNNNIPDIARADWLVEDLEEYRRNHQGAIPRFLNITLCNDHGADPAPERGFPYVASYMADNDLALGRVVAFLSRQPEWRKMAIFVTQDDSGGDNDSVDRHRSFVLCISPWAKRGYVSHVHTSIMSIIKTIYRLFGLEANNLYDATATDLSDLFTEDPDFTPYSYLPSDPRVFRPEDTFDPLDPNFERRRRESPQVKMDDPAFVESLRDNN